VPWLTSPWLEAGARPNLERLRVYLFREIFGSVQVVGRVQTQGTGAVHGAGTFRGGTPNALAFLIEAIRHPADLFAQLRVGIVGLAAEIPVFVLGAAALVLWATPAALIGTWLGVVLLHQALRAVAGWRRAHVEYVRLPTVERTGFVRYWLGRLTWRSVAGYILDFALRTAAFSGYLLMGLAVGPGMLAGFGVLAVVMHVAYDAWIFSRNYAQAKAAPVLAFPAEELVEPEAARPPTSETAPTPLTQAYLDRLAGVSFADLLPPSFVQNVLGMPDASAEHLPAFDAANKDELRDLIRQARASNLDPERIVGVRLLQSVDHGQAVRASFVVLRF
jgi:hypothetical protein